jgi:maleylacetate reductase
MTAIGPFVFPGLRSRVIFGFGTIAQTFAEIEKLGRARSLVLSTPNQKTDAEVLAQRLGALCVGVFADAAMHTPVHITELALTVFTSGVPIAWSRSAAARPPAGQSHRRPHRRRSGCHPDRYAGSEMTDILGETVSGEKTTRICFRPSVPGAKRASWP